jgi:hypothetical protein
MLLTHAHMISGMGVEVAGTKHVATASFNVAGGHIKIGFGSFLLRGRTEIDEAGGEREERKQKQTGQTHHDPPKRLSRIGPNRDRGESTPTTIR